MTFNIATLTAYIAAQTITATINGATVTLKMFDIGTMPDEMMKRDCPCFMPNVIGGAADGSEISRVTFGAGGISSTDARKNLVYTLKYRMLYAPVGSGRFAVKTHLPGILAMTGSILAKFIGTAFDVVSGIIECHPLSWSSPQNSVTDPSGKEFYGVDFAFIVKEFTELG